MRSLLRLIANLVRLALAPLWLPWHVHRAPRGSWVHLRLAPHLTELGADAPWWQRLVARTEYRGMSRLRSVRQLTEYLAADSQRTGLVLELESLEVGWALCTSLRNLVLELKNRGKSVVAYLPHGAGNRELYVASAADRILVSPQCSVWPLGIAGQPLYVKGLLDRLGVRLQVSAQGEFKTAAEPFTNEQMSEAQREQLTALLQTVQGRLQWAIGSRRGWDEARTQDIFRTGMYHAREAIEAELVDGACYPDELPAQVVGADAGSQSLAEGRRYLRWHRARLWHPVRPRPYVAVVSVRGAIFLDSAWAPARGNASSRQVVARLRSAGRDPLALGVVLLVDSPGGSALASDLIHREVSRLNERKPVVAALADVAASGGYYIAAAARAIVAQPTTITGSIGVVSAKVVAEELLKRLPVQAHTLRMAPHADMLSPLRALDPEELRMLERQGEHFYRAFISVVAAGRGKREEEIAEVAGGRVWSGEAAVARGLADELGGLDDAVGMLRDMLPEVPDEVRSALEPRVVGPLRHEVAPDDGGRPADAERRARWGAFSPQLGTKEWVLYYAPELDDLL